MRTAYKWLLLAGGVGVLAFGAQAYFYKPVPAPTPAAPEPAATAVMPAADATAGQAAPEAAKNEAGAAAGKAVKPAGKKQYPTQHAERTYEELPAEAPVDLSGHSMSLKREEKKGYELLPGVEVKSGGVQIKMDEQKQETIEIKRNPDNSNQDYQILLKRKF